MALENLVGKKNTNVVPDVPPTAGERLYTEKPLDPKTNPPGYAGKEGYDPESNGGAGRRMSRIDSKAFGSDTDSTLSVGQQMELEKDNAIKYRTCSWPKVITPLPKRFSDRL